MSEQDSYFAAAFAYVRAVYSSASKLLHATGPAMSDRKFEPYDDWDNVWPERSGAGYDEPGRWLKSWALRQFHERGRAEVDVFTVATVFFDYDRPGFRPLLIASRMTVAGTDGDEIYRLPLVQRWTGESADGDARWISLSAPGLPGFILQSRSQVVGQRVLSAALPLLDVTSSERLEWLIDQVLTSPDRST